MCRALTQASNSEENREINRNTHVHKYHDELTITNIRGIKNDRERERLVCCLFCRSIRKDKIKVVEEEDEKEKRVGLLVV